MTKITRRSALAGLLASALVAALPFRAMAQAAAGEALDLPFGLALEGGTGAWPGKTNLVLTHFDRAIGSVAQAATRQPADGQLQMALQTILIDTDPTEGGLLASSAGMVASGEPEDIRYFQVKKTLIGLRPSGKLASLLGIPDDVLMGPVAEIADIAGQQTDGNWDIACQQASLGLAPLQAIVPVLGSLLDRMGIKRVGLKNIDVSYVSRGGGDAARSVTLNGMLIGFGEDGAEIDLAQLSSTQNIGPQADGMALLSGNLALEDLGLTNLLKQKGGDLVNKITSMGALLSAGLVAAGWGMDTAGDDAKAIIAWLETGSKLLVTATPPQPVPFSKLASYPRDLGGIRQLVQEAGIRIERRQA